MGDTEAKTVLGRIAAAGREERKARAMTLQKALRVTMAKVADSLLDLPMAVIGAVVQEVDGDAIEAALKDESLLLLMDGPAGCTGAVMIEPVVVGALIQQQTIGSVSADSGQTRAMTRTDGAICAPLIDALITRAAPILDSADDRALIDEFQFGAKAEDARTLAMALDASDYVTITLTVDIARGVRQGEITLILPTLAARKSLHSTPEDEDAVDDKGADGPDLAKLVMGLNAELQMVMCHLNLPLKTVRDLKVGQTLNLTPGAFPNVQIMTRMGRVLGRGVVGHVDGVRAVKPSRPPSHAAQPLRRASDQPLVDMPEVEVLTATGRRSTLPRQDEVSEADIEAAMHELPPLDSAETDSSMADVSVVPTQVELEESTVADLAPLDLEDVPDLDDLPDLESLPDLAELPDLAMRSVG